jgi:muconate cycloisomerase
MNMHLTPMRVESVRTSLLNIPLVRPHVTSVARIQYQSSVLVRVRTTDGVEGFGEAVVPGGPWWSGDSIEGIEALIHRYLAPLLIGEDAANIDFQIQRLNRLVPGAHFAKAGVDMALWDARGKSLGVPVYQLLGGADRSRLPVTWAPGADAAEVVAREIQEKLAKGVHSSFKLKMGKTDPESDVARIADVSRRIPAGTPLAVDLNGAWDELTARRWIPALCDVGVSLIEQPLARWDLEGLARILSLTKAAIMADESLIDVHDAQRLAQSRAVNVFAQKLAKSGGIREVQRIGVIAEACGISCYGGTTIESSLGTAAAVHAFCASGSLTAGTELFGPLLLADDIVEEPIRYSDGYVHLNGGPGFGVALDERKIAKYAR